MTRKRAVGRFGRLVLWFSPNLIVCAGFLAALRWMTPTPVAAAIMTTAAAIFVLGYSRFLAKRQSRDWDEVQRASWGFACAHGCGWGGGVTLLLLTLPPVTNWLIDRINTVGRATAASPEAADYVAVRLALLGGITLLMVMQALAVVVASFVWQRRMDGFGEPS